MSSLAYAKVPKMLNPANPVSVYYHKKDCNDVNKNKDYQENNPADYTNKEPHKFGISDVFLLGGAGLSFITLGYISFSKKWR